MYSLYVYDKTEIGKQEVWVQETEMEPGLKGNLPIFCITIGSQFYGKNIWKYVRRSRKFLQFSIYSNSLLYGIFVVVVQIRALARLPSSRWLLEELSLPN